MPSISRARIVNFSYNDGARLIPDVLFDFSDSKGGTLDTLLNLENGGGKTVLVQLLLQPVIPGAKVQTRRISEYFRKSTDCSYILLEWKLECSTNHLLTGIAITSSQNTKESEENKSIKYYTFLHNYHSIGDKYDIVNLPLSETKDGKFIPVPFEKGRVLVKNMKYYHSEDVRQYQSELEEYGITHSEWENILVKINEREGGIEKFIEGYHTTDKLLDQFIIPGISAGNEKNDDLEASIDMMFMNYAESCAQMDDKLKLRENIATFIEQLEAFKPQVESLWTRSEQKRASIKQLFDYIHSLKFVISNAEKDLVQLSDKKVALDEKALHIELEQYSEQYYSQTEQYEKESQALASATHGVEKAETQKRQAEHMQNVLHAADKFQDLKDALSKKECLEIKLRSLTDENFDNHVQSIRFSLHTVAKQLLEETEKQLAELSETIAENTASVKYMQQKQCDLCTEKEQLQSETDSLLGQKKQLGKDIADELAKLNIVITQMLDESFHPEEIEHTKQQFQVEITNCNDTEKKLCAEREQLELRAHECQQTSINLEIEKLTIKQQMETIQQELDAFQEKYRVACEVVYALSMHKSLIFTEEPSRNLQSQIDELKDNIKSTERKMESLHEQKKYAEKGTIHIPQSAIDFLDETGVDYQTGTAYLAKQTGLRECVLRTEPLVAFSVIVNLEKERKAIFDHVTENSWIMAAVPVFTYAEIVEIADGTSVRNTHFLTAYSHAYFSDKELYLQKI